MGLYQSQYGVVDAFKWTGGRPDQTEDPVWAVDAIRSGRIRFQNKMNPYVCLIVETPDGDDVAARGNWIVRDAKGDLYVFDDETFRRACRPAE
jgi:hypothetical protein